jgi:hypothetical protein
VLFIDHIALKYVNTQNKFNNRHAKWVSFLQGYTFVFKHKSQQQNHVTDALIQCTILLKTMENQVLGFVALKDLYAFDNDFWEIVEQLKNLVTRNMDLNQGQYFMQYLYLFKGKQLCIPNGPMRENMLKDLHSSGLAGHFSKDKTLALIKDKYY